MTDYNNMAEILANDPDAQKIATEQAVSERISRMAADEQAAQLMGMSIRIANPNAARPQPRKAPELDIYQASELYGAQLEHTPMIVPNMLPIGLSVLAGAPKRGKSWLSLALALAVAGGKTFLGQQCRQGDVLYLDLESRKYRVQDRLAKLITGPAPPRLYIAHDAAPLGDELYAQLDGWCKAVQEPTLIIIDTLGRVRAGGKKSSENAYESDTRMYGGLQKWATGHRLAVLVVHHLRKVKDSDDWFDKINGSNGLVGAADTVFGLGGARGEPVSRFMVSGRDIDGDYELAIRFDGGRWVLENASGENWETERDFNTSPTIRGVYRLMQCMPSWQGTANDLRDAIVEATGEPISQNASDVQKDLTQYAQLLYDRFRILAGHRRQQSGRRVIFLQNKADDYKMEG